MIKEEESSMIEEDKEENGKVLTSSIKPSTFLKK